MCSHSAKSCEGDEKLIGPNCCFKCYSSAEPIYVINAAINNKVRFVLSDDTRNCKRAVTQESVLTTIDFVMGKTIGNHTGSVFIPVNIE